VARPNFDFGSAIFRVGRISSRLNFGQMGIVIDSSRKKQEQSATNSDPCLYCKETLNIGKWIQCQMCAKWAHYECAGADDNFFNFVCELCNCYDTNYCQQYGARVTV